MSKIKGSNAERELIHLFWKHGWAACRVAGSGSMKYPSPDIIACKSGHYLAIECKYSSSEKKYIDKSEIADLVEYSTIAGIKPLVGIRFKRSEWLLLNVNDLVSAGKNFVISQQFAKQKGVTLPNLTKSL